MCTFITVSTFYLGRPQHGLIGGYIGNREGNISVSNRYLDHSRSIVQSQVVDVNPLEE